MWGMMNAMREESSVDLVYNYIKEQIANSTIFPGNSIVEEELAQKTGVSRISVRGALTRLRYEGYIDGRPNHSARLVSPTKEDMHRIFEVRFTLESAAIRLAVRNRSKKLCDRLNMLLEEERNSNTQFSIPEYVRINRQIHFEIINASKNEYYIKFLNEIYNKCDVYLMFFDKSQSNEASAVTHGKMVKAFIDGDLQGATSALAEDMGLVTF